jgi:uncharacterized membrane protein
MISFVGVGAFLLALACGVVARLFVPDHLMRVPSAPFSTAESIAATVYVFVFVCWLAIYMRAPRRARLAAFGAAWTSVATLFLAREVSAGQWSLIPPLAIAGSLCLLTALDWYRIRRSTPAHPAA